MKSMISGAVHAVASRTRYQIILIILAGLIVYSNTFHVPFQFDDFDNLTNNPIIKSLGNFISSSKGYDYNPRRFIGFLSFALNYHFGGLDVTGYHIVNIVIHIANSILVYFLVLLTFRGSGTWDQGPETRFPVPGSPSPVPGSESPVPGPRSLPPNLVAFFSSLLFAVHPIQTEAVTYIVQRFASLAAMFYLMSVVAYIKARIGNRQSAIGNGLDSKKAIPYSRITFFLISLVSAVLAMMTKENAFTLPFVIVLYEFCFFSYTYSPSPIAHRRSSLDSRFYYLIPILLTMLLIPVTILGTNRPLGEIISDMSERLRAQSYLPRWDYLMTQLRVITTYIRLIFLPVNQDLDYDYPVYHSFFALPVILSFVFLAALFGLGVYMIIGNRQWAIGNGIKAKGKEDDSRPFRLIGFGILWFFITLSVESSVIPIADVIFEHRLYLPLAGALIALTASALMIAEKLAAKWKDMERAVIISLSLITVAFSAAAYARNMVWHDEVGLWKDIVIKSPNKSRAHYNLGLAYQARNMPDKAIEQYLAALTLKPNDSDAHNNLGLVYYSLNMPDKAEEQYLTALKLKPDFAQAHNNLGAVYQTRNMPDKAMEQYLIALKLKPDYVDAYKNLGLIYQARNMPDKAIEQYLTALKLKPEDPDAHFNLGVFYQTLNVPDKAMEQYLIAIKLKPDSADAHYNLGVIYLTLNMYTKAVNELQLAVTLNPNDPEEHFNLGFAYYKTGQMENAQRELLAVLKIKPDDQKAQQLLNQAIGKIGNRQ